MKFDTTALTRAGCVLLSAAFSSITIGLQATALELAQSPTPAATPTPATPTPTPAAPAPAAPVAPQSVDTPLFERSSYINGCRRANTTTEIFLNTALGPVNQRVGTVTAGTQVTLTGVLGNIAGVGSVAQIKTPTVGWVNAANLTTCDGGGLPSKSTCYFIKTSTAPNGLLAYEDPVTKQRQTYRGQSDGPAGGSRIYFTNPAISPQTVEGIVYVKVFYTSLNGGDRLGWISQGPAGSTPGSRGSNFAPCVN